MSVFETKNRKNIARNALIPVTEICSKAPVVAPSVRHISNNNTVTNVVKQFRDANQSDKNSSRDRFQRLISVADGSGFGNSDDNNKTVNNNSKIISKIIKEPNLCRDLNKDVISVLVSKLEFVDIYFLLMTCRSLAKIISEYSERYQIELAPKIKLRPLQGMLRDQFSKYKGDIITFCAPKSFGKTIAGCGCVNGATVICASSNTLKVWIVELKEKLNWYNPNPENSKVLVFSSTIRKHWNYLKNFPKNRTSAIILVSDCNLRNAMDVICNITEQKEKILIIDEAHYNRTPVVDELSLHRYTKCLMLSATNIVRNVIGIPETATVRSIVVGGLGKVPEVVWHINKLTEEEIDLRSLDQPNHDYISSICQKYKKTAIVSTVDFLNNVNTKNISECKIFYQKTGVNTIPKFNNTNEKAVLLLNSNQNEGINVYANAIIIANPGTMNAERVGQTVGRIVRTGNTNRRVHIYMLCANNYALYRSIYAKCYYSAEWPFPYNTLPDEKYLNKSMQLIKVLGINPIDIIPSDGCILFNDNSVKTYTADMIVDWWSRNISIKGYQTKLNETIIRNIL